MKMSKKRAKPKNQKGFKEGYSKNLTTKEINLQQGKARYC